MNNNIWAILRNSWASGDLRRKIMFTAGIIILFRIGANLPVPFLNSDTISSFFNADGSLLSYFNMLSGNTLAQGTVFALTVQPYINASIIIQLLTVALPPLERLAKDGGEAGRKKIQTITRYVTIGIALIQAFGYYTILRYQANAIPSEYTTGAMGWIVMAAIVVLLMAGSMLVMWMGESIDEHGIGNGVSMILFASIVSRGIDLVLYGTAAIQQGNWWIVPLILILGLLMLCFIVFMDGAERRIPIQYAKRQVGRKMYGGQSSFLPIKVAMTGVMPIIFTYAIVGLPATIAQFLSSDNRKVVFHHFCSVHYPVVPVDHRVQLFLYFHSVQSCGNI